MQGAIIENGVVTNVILLPENFEGDEWGGKPLVVSAEAAIGDSYVDGVFVKPPQPEPEIQVPQSVTMRQARLALLQAGLLANVDAAINSLSSPQKEAAAIEWEYSQEVHRDREFVTQLTAAMGLTELQVDDLFILAATL